jgi:LPPG:FO 2-phospho-L-lactate transferase
MIAVLAGGVGAARFLEGVAQLMPGDAIAAIVNTGDDVQLHGLMISPDVDIVLYTLAGIIEPTQGWGVRDDTTAVLTMLQRLGVDTWFKLGDQDLAVHIMRSALLRAGARPTTIAAQLRTALGCPVRVLPMTDDAVATHIITPDGAIHFQEYLVRRRARDAVLGVAFHGIEHARPTAEVLAALADAEALLIAPSNPVVSVGTILALPGMRAAIAAAGMPVVAVSPIVAGAPIKGPAAPLMRAQGFAVSALGVAQCYHGLIDVLVIDDADRALRPAIEALGIAVVVTDTIMRGPAEKAALARAALDAARRHAAGAHP